MAMGEMVVVPDSSTLPMLRIGGPYPQVDGRNSERKLDSLDDAIKIVADI
jgi:hypothetical protein